MNCRLLSLIGAALLPCLGLVLLSGCGSGQPTLAPARIIKVTVSKPLLRKDLDYLEYTGRTEAVEMVEVRARATGYLDKINFVSGAMVKKNDILFEVDPRTYKADLDKAEAEVARNQASLERYSADLARARRLVVGNAISREDYDKTVGQQGETQAALESARASAARNRLELEFTKVRAPVDGRISRNLISVGNLVTKDDTKLTTIVSVDPVWAYFDVDERSVLHVQRLIKAGKAKGARESKVPVYLGLQDEKGYPREGYIDFIDNRIDPSTGTLRIRGLFKNTDGLLSAGLFIRVRVPIGEPRNALLVNETAIGTDQGQKFLYLVGKDKKVISRPVTLGASREGLRVIEEGISADEWIIVNGLQRVRAGVEVEAVEAPMPVPPAARVPLAAEKGKPADKNGPNGPGK